MIEESAYRALEEAVGSEHASREPAVLDSYSFQTLANPDANVGWVPRPEAVVLPGSTEEVQAVVRACNAHGLQFKPFTTGWGAWAGAGHEGVVQIDLRRMNRILEIDEKNMYAVVEPYVTCAQLQAETLKRGLNLHIIGAGCGTSPLASVTSGWGTGWTGLTTSYGPRNFMGAEWVTPTAEVVRIGHPDGGEGWFNGDGPGPSLRGLVRGYAGFLGSLGVFTRASIKLYNWPGPPAPEVKGMYTDMHIRMPENFKIFLCTFPSYKLYADAGYKMVDAEIGYMLCKNSVGMTLAAFTPRLMRKLTQRSSLRTMAKSNQHMLQVMVAGDSPGHLDYQVSTLHQIVGECEGMALDLGFMPSLSSFLWWGFIRAAMPPAIFRMGGCFITSLGGIDCWDNTVRGAEIGEGIKQRMIDDGYMIDDLADNAWGGIYEGHFSHQEELGLIDPRDARHAEGSMRFVFECNQASVDNALGIGLSCVVPGACNALGPVTCDYDKWQQRIKDTFDPGDAADSTWYAPIDMEQIPDEWK
jgi:FAD/FMN-containing dehydrogenase